MNLETLDGMFRQIFAKPAAPNDPPAMSWSELANLTHETQVATFGWCSCEDNDGDDMPYDDCPPAGEPRFR